MGSGTKIDDKTRLRIRDQYRGGTPRSALAKRFSLNYNTIYKITKDISRIHHIIID